MVVQRVRLGLSLSMACAITLAMALPALAQNNATTTITAPDYGSGASAGALSNGNFNTPESDGRPGVKFFTLAVRAFRKGDYPHAIDMYKVAASWAYKPAEYNLGIMYFKGQGVPVDRARGAAWMVLAAERGTPLYLRARDLMITALTDAQFKRTDAIWSQLKPTFGDAVALRRAKVQWAWVRTHHTGTRVGGATGELSIGVSDQSHSPSPTDSNGSPLRGATTASEFMQGGSIDGSIAYRQFEESDNPYDPIFLKNRSGTVSVEPMQRVKPTHGKLKKENPSTNGSTQPSQPPQNA